MCPPLPYRSGHVCRERQTTIEPGRAGLSAWRTLKMARSAHGCVRGNTAKFHDGLERSPVSARVLQGPSIWICGDCHVGNLRPLSNSDGRVEVQIRDMDPVASGGSAARCSSATWRRRTSSSSSTNSAAARR
ncbi:MULTISPECIES: DUF2252 family protein [Sphingomonas]|uniref:DUF2252 family protein n=1 Tax=Sphingomonas TaxID=13687 RepID=UPI002407F429|nr:MULTISPECIES: DUF2252 family protein [unclassified Sphingomonas]